MTKYFMKTLRSIWLCHFLVWPGHILQWNHKKCTCQPSWFVCNKNQKATTFCFFSLVQTKWSKVWMPPSFSPNMDWKLVSSSWTEVPRCVKAGEKEGRTSAEQSVHPFILPPLPPEQSLAGVSSFYRHYGWLTSLTKLWWPLASRRHAAAAMWLRLTEAQDRSVCFCLRPIKQIVAALNCSGSSNILIGCGDHQWSLP